MKVIHKFPLNMGSNSLLLDIGAVFLHIECEPFQVVVYALIDQDSATKLSREVRLIYTGEVIPADGSYDYIGTATNSGHIAAGSAMYRVYHALEKK